MDKEIRFPGTTSKERSYLVSMERKYKSNGIEFKWEFILENFRAGVVEDIIKVDTFVKDKKGVELKNDGSKRYQKHGKINRGIAGTNYKNVKGAFGSQDPSYNKNPKVFAKKKEKKLSLWNSTISTLSSIFNKDQ